MKQQTTQQTKQHTTQPTDISHPHAVILQTGREKPIRQGHPWIFSGAIRSLPSAVADGEVVDVLDANGGWLARGFLNRASQIQVRLFSWQQDERIDTAFWRHRLTQAIDRRANLRTQTTACRLVNGENDYLPGLIVDQYADYLVIQIGSLGMERLKGQVAALIQEVTGCRGVIERSEVSLRRQEGLTAVSGLLLGTAPNGPIEIVEEGLRVYVDVMDGQKTGYYTDQRANRRRVAAYCAGTKVLNAFSYTGAFALYALRANAAHVVNVDSSLDALQTLEANLHLNGFDPEQQSEQIVADVFTLLRDWRADPLEGGEERRFDLIILDPPKFAQHKGHLDRALRGYKDINLLAMQLLKPNGLLATFSCSGLVSADLFQKVVFGAAVDAKRQVQILEWLRQDVDHPVAITFPEGEYLKGLICRVL